MYRLVRKVENANPDLDLQVMTTHLVVCAIAATMSHPAMSGFSAIDASDGTIQGVDHRMEMVHVSIVRNSAITAELLSLMSKTFMSSLVDPDCGLHFLPFFIH
jgi:hypothetical protein